MENQVIDKPKRVHLKDRTSENDIKYRGPLSYRYLRIVAWLLLALVQLGVVLSLAAKVNENFHINVEAITYVSNFLADMPLPLFLLANFAFILQKRNSLKKALLFYGGIAFAMYAGAIFITSFYGSRILIVINGKEMSYWDTCLTLGTLLTGLGQKMYVFNIFVDLFLCVLVYFFLNYTPKKRFVGKKLIIFRLFCIIPLIYETTMLVIKYLVLNSVFSIPTYVFFLLPSKPPLSFLAITTIIFFIKIHHVKFMKEHQDVAKYEEHLATNANSLRVSFLISVIFAIFAIIDFIVFVIFCAAHMSAAGIPGDQPEFDALIVNTIQLADNLGFGKSISLLFTIPFVMLFSYSKTHNNPQVDKFIPLAGIGLIVLIYIEGIFEIFIGKAGELFNTNEEVLLEEAQYMIDSVSRTIKRIINK